MPQSYIKVLADVEGFCQYNFHVEDHARIA